MTELDRAAMAAVVIGASRPEDNPEVAKRLARTADELRAYLEAREGFGLPKHRLCWLYDNIGAPHEQEQAVAAAVNSWTNELRTSPSGANAPLNLLLFIISHAERENGNVLLAASRYGETKPILDVDRLSSRLVSNAPLGSRYFVYLDCCYAGGVFEAMKFRPRGDFGLDAETSTQRETSARPVGVTRGVWGLIAANKELRAWAPPGDQLTRMSTLFFEALCARPKAVLSLDEIEGRMISALKQREATLESWRRLTTPQPYVQLKTEENLEQLDKAPLFPSGWRSEIPAFHFPTKIDQSRMTVVVVTREAGSDKLIDTVMAALDRVEKESPPLVGHEHATPHIVRLDTTHAFDSAEELSKRLRALCKADLVVFDVTATERQQFEPGIMLLLGVRAVVRRGVTICSVDAEPGNVFDYTLPYNLMFVNLASHDEPFDTGPKILAAKITSGFRELKDNPNYLDLPVFDAVRELGHSLDAYRPRPYDEGVLYLGPFERTFQKTCFVPLEQALKSSLNGLAKKRLGRSYTESHEPHVRRLLDNDASKLVALSVYEAIRRYDFCLVDWSELRPNVLFELGVRLASNENGAVHIVAETRQRKCEMRQLDALQQLFNPMVYRQGTFEDRKQVAESILATLFDKNARRRDKRFYSEIAAACEPPIMHGVDALIGELSTRADLAHIYDVNDRSSSAAIYANENLAIKNAVFTKAVGLRLAALFLEMGHGDRHEAMRDRILELKQQVDELERNRGREVDIKILRNGLKSLAGVLSALRMNYKGGIAT